MYMQYCPVYLPKFKPDSGLIVTNYSNNSCLDCTMHTEGFTIFSLDLNFARCLDTCPLLL